MLVSVVCFFNCYLFEKSNFVCFVIVENLKCLFIGSSNKISDMIIGIKVVSKKVLYKWSVVLFGRGKKNNLVMMLFRMLIMVW